ncbi:hypothetical protein EV183_004754 [Coemansia sp. RSA 2336]|nr:hypothetical protein EV183_004754 [Coemansia sp. RSA 2336]
MKCTLAFVYIAGLQTWMVAAYQDIWLEPGQYYAASKLQAVHGAIQRYMRFSIAASSFVDVSAGWSGCGQACSTSDIQDAMLNVTWHIDLPLSDGLIAVQHKAREIVVAWAGTHRYRALVTDMAVFPLPYIPGTSIGVYGGFLDSVRGVIDAVARSLEELMSEYPDYTVIFTGHSKGGGEAAISALDLVRRIEGLQSRARVWTFGEPRLGDMQFAALYNRRLGNVTYRVTSLADPVVVMPPKFLVDYCHHNTELWIMNEEGDIYVGQNHADCLEDPRASSSIAFYDRSIQWHKNYLGLPPPDHANALFSW